MAQKLAKRPAQAKKAQPSKAAPLAAKPRNKGALVGGILAAVFLAIALEGYFFMKSEAAKDIVLEHSGPILPHAVPDTHSLKGDKDGNFYRLNGRDMTWKLEKYSPDFTLLAEYTPKKSDQMLVNASDFAVDSAGNVYVVQNDGQVKVLDSSMKYVKTFQIHESDCIAADTDSKDRLYVVTRGGNKVVLFNADGDKVGEFGTPGSPSGALSHPLRIVVQPKDRIVVLEEIDGGNRVKVLDPDFKVKKSFIIDQKYIHYFAYTGMGVDPENRVFFNSQGGEYNVVVFNTDNGKFLGSSKSTKDNQAILGPGCLGVNKFNGDIYVDFIPGIMKCRMPSTKS